MEKQLYPHGRACVMISPTNPRQWRVSPEVQCKGLEKDLNGDMNHRLQNEDPFVGQQANV